MRTLTTVIIFLITVCSGVSAQDFQVNSILGWNGSTPGKLIRRNIEFAHTAETELQLGRNLNRHFSLFADYTEDSKDNHRLGVAFSRKDSYGPYNLGTNLHLWKGLGESKDRVKVSGTWSRKVGNKLSLGLYGLTSKVNTRPRYTEYGPALLFQTNHLNLNLYLLKKNTGHTGIEVDVKYTI